MRVLLAYDASGGADDALADLALACLPLPVEARVVTVAEPAGREPSPASSAASFGTGARRGRAHLAEEHARAVASRGVARIASAFPAWRTDSVVVEGDAAEATLEAAESWRPDLVVVGSHGHPAGARTPALGRVGRRIVDQAACSVRVGRARTRSPGGVRLLVGYDRSEGADAAVAAVAARRWPAGSTAHVLVAVDPVVAHVAPDPESGGIPWRDLRTAAAARAAALRDAGLGATSEVVTGDPRRVLTEEAERRGADLIVIGARGAGGSGRRLIGSVTASVVERAGCSVEVIRSPGAGGSGPPATA